MKANVLSSGLLLTGVLLATTPSHGQEAPVSDTAPSDTPAPVAMPAAPQQDTPAPAPAPEELATIPLEPAAPPPVAEPAAGPSNRAMEEIVVTAQKREEALQDVPISIQAFSGDALEARGVDDTLDLGQVIPALQFTGVVGYTLVYLRGVGTDAFAPSSDPSVATYIDGVYIPAGHGIFQAFGGVERVEVLKGPQGALFGRNSTGGAISVITKEPDPSVAEGTIDLEVGNFNSRSAKIYLSTPITDWFSASVSGLITQADNIYTHVARSIPDDDIRAVRVKLNFHPSDTLELSLTGFESEQQVLSSVISKNTEPSLLARLATIQPAEDNYRAEIDYPADLIGKQSIYYGTLTWQLPGLDFKLIGSDEYILTDFASTDFDGSPVPIAAFDSPNQYSDFQTVEAQFLSNESSWGAEHFQWITGLYYLRSKVGYDPAHLYVGPDLANIFLGAITDPLLGGLIPGGLNIPAGLQTALTKTPIGPDGLSIEFNGLLGTRSYSAFAQGTWFATEWMDITLGGRYQKEERFLIAANTSVESPDGTGSVQAFSFPLDESEVTNFSPKAVISVRPFDDTLIYASWSTGFKSATYNIVNVYESPDFVKPEEVTQYELGIKADFLDGLLRFNGAIFETTIQDLQSGFVSLLAGGAVTLENAGEAQIRGAEFDALWAPMPNWNPGLVLTANAAYLDAEYTDYQQGSGYNETTGVFSDNLDFTGNRIVRAPEWSGGLGIVQTLRSSENSEMELALNGYFNDGFFYTPQNTVEEGAYSLLDGRISILFERWDLRLTVFGKNLLDERYHNAQFQTDFGINKTLANPRQYGMRLGWEF